MPSAAPDQLDTLTPAHPVWPTKHSRASKKGQTILTGKWKVEVILPVCLQITKQSGVRELKWCFLGVGALAGPAVSCPLSPPSACTPAEPVPSPSPISYWETLPRALRSKMLKDLLHAIGNRRGDAWSTTDIRKVWGRQASKQAPCGCWLAGCVRRETAPSKGRPLAEVPSVYHVNPRQPRPGNISPP